MPIPRSVIDQINKFEAEGYTATEILDGLQRSRYQSIADQIRDFRFRRYTDEEILAGLKTSPIEEPPILSRVAKGAMEIISEGLSPKAVGKAAVGGAETAASLLTSLYGLPASGVAGLAALPWGLEASKKAIEKAQELLIYQPKTETGQKAAEIAFYPFAKLQEAGQAVGEKVLEKTGSPLAATAADVAVQTAPFFAIPQLRGKRPQAKPTVSEVTPEPYQQPRLIEVQRKALPPAPEPPMVEPTTVPIPLPPASEGFIIIPKSELRKAYTEGRPTKAEIFVQTDEGPKPARWNAEKKAYEIIEEGKPEVKVIAEERPSIIEAVKEEAAVPKEIIKEAKTEPEAIMATEAKLSPEAEPFYLRSIQGKTKALETGKAPTLVVTGGPPGAGKSTSLSGIDLKNYVEVNADKIKAMAGKESEAPAFHETSSKIAKEILNKAIDEGYNVIYDSALTNYPLIKNSIEKTLRSGGTVDILFTDIGLNTSIVRSSVRQLAGETQREVPIEASIKAYNYSLPTFLQLFKEYKGNPRVTFRLRSNDVDFQSPIEVFEQRNGEQIIHNKELFEKIMSTHYNEVRKGGEKRYERYPKATESDVEANRAEIISRRNEILARRDKEGARGGIEDFGRMGSGHGQPRSPLEGPERGLARDTRQSIPQKVEPAYEAEPKAEPPQLTQKFKDIDEWKSARNRELREAEKIADPRERIEAVNAIIEKYKQLAKEGWATTEGIAPVIRIKARKEIAAQEKKKRPSVLSKVLEEPKEPEAPISEPPKPVEPVAKASAEVAAEKVSFLEESLRNKAESAIDQVKENPSPPNLKKADIAVKKYFDHLVNLEADRIASHGIISKKDAVWKLNKSAFEAVNAAVKFKDLKSAEKTFRDDVGRIILHEIVPYTGLKAFPHTEIKIEPEPRGVRTLKEQKKYLIDAIDEAIKNAPEEVKGLPREYILIEVPGDGEFRVINRKAELLAFKKEASANFPSSERTIPHRKAGPSIRPSGKRIDGDVEYYNEFRLRNIEPYISTQDYFYGRGFYSDGHYAIKIEKPSPPKGLKRYVKDEEASNLIGGILKLAERTKNRAEILAEFNVGGSEKSKPFIHIKANTGEDVLLNPVYVDSILSKYPDAKPFYNKDQNFVVFKIGDNVVGVIKGINFESSGVSAEWLNERLLDLRGAGQKEKPISEMRKGEAGFIEIPHPSMIIRSIKEFFDPLTSLPEKEKFLSFRYKTLGNLDRVEGIVKRIFDKTKGLDQDVKRDIFRFLDGQIPIDSLPPNVRVMAQNLRTINNLIGEMLVKRGLLSREAFEAHKNQYVRYLYLKHILGDEPIPVSQSGRLDFSYLKARKDLTPEQRRAIGLIEDVSIAEPFGVSKPLSDIAKYDFYEKISRNPSWVWEPSIVEVEGRRMGIGHLVEEVEIQRKMARQAPNVPEIEQKLSVLEEALKKAIDETKNVPEDFVQMPVSENWGPLSGAFVRKEIYRDIVPLITRIQEPRPFKSLVNTALDIGEQGMTLFKVFKAPLNIPTVFRNIVSNYIQLNMSGIPFQEIPAYMVKAARAMLNNDQAYVQARRNGLFKTNWAEGEIREVLQLVKTMESGSLPDVFGGITRLAKYYGKIDDFYKLAKFIEQTEKGIPIEKAVIEAQKWGMDYSLATPAIKYARRFFIPFATYQYKIAPLIAETLARRPWVIAKYAAIPYIMQEVARETLKLTDEDWKKLKAMLPTFIKKENTYAILPWKSPEGNPQWVNLGFFLPWGNFHSLFGDIKRGEIKEIIGDIGMGNPFLDVYSALKTVKGDAPPKDPFTGREIYNQLDSPSEKAIKMAEWLYSKWAPPMLTREGALGYTMKAISGEKDRYGRIVTPGQAGARWIGFNIVAPHPIQAAIERRIKTEELRAALAKIIKDPNLTASKKNEAIRKFLNEIRQMEAQ